MGSSTSSSRCCRAAAKAYKGEEKKEEEEEVKRSWKKTESRREAESGGGVDHSRWTPDLREEAALHRIPGRMFVNGAGQVACLQTQLGSKKAPTKMTC